MLRYTYTLLLSMLCLCGAWADSLQISVLTCAPGTDVYAHFGHTAIRLKNLDKQDDIVFNYGCFDYTEEMFVYKFIKGETDYLLEVEPADFFFKRYEYMGVQVDEQVLNITQPEAMNLFRLLVLNLQPENKQYRYSYLYDNCTTRARDMIESALTEEVFYKKSSKRLTARQELHECMQKAPWLRFGIDLVLGEEIDDPTFDKRHQMFIPAHFEAELDSAFIARDGGKLQPLISSKETILQPNPTKEEADTIITPTIVLCFMFIATLFMSIIDFCKRKVTYTLDATLCMTQGIAGILISFLFFCSEHPAVNSNWLVGVFNPLFIAYAAYLIYCIVKKKNNVMAIAYMLIMIAFSITAMFVNQSFDIPTKLVILTLLTRSIFVYATELRIRKRKNNKNVQ